MPAFLRVSRQLQWPAAQHRLQLQLQLSGSVSVHAAQLGCQHICCSAGKGACAGTLEVTDGSLVAAATADDATLSARNRHTTATAARAR